MANQSGFRHILVHNRLGMLNAFQYLLSLIMVDNVVGSTIYFCCLVFLFFHPVWCTNLHVPVYVVSSYVYAVLKQPYVRSMSARAQHTHTHVHILTFWILARSKRRQVFQTFDQTERKLQTTY